MTTDSSRSVLSLNSTLPVNIRPISLVHIAVRNYSGGGASVNPAMLEIGASGEIVIYNNFVSTGTWLSGYQCGMWNATVSYRIP